MGRYVTLTEVRIRLAGKVRFSEDDDDDDKVGPRLLGRLVSEAESQVELDLSPRYRSPLAADEAAFNTLPQSPTRDVIKTLCELMAVLRVLETDFGRGSATDAEKYTANTQKRYDAIVAQLLKRRGALDDTNQWLYPPLPGLGFALGNEVADNGYQGAVLTTSTGDGGYAADQITNPSRTFWDGRIDPRFDWNRR